MRLERGRRAAIYLSMSAPARQSVVDRRRTTLPSMPVVVLTWSVVIAYQSAVRLFSGNTVIDPARGLELHGELGAELRCLFPTNAPPVTRAAAPPADSRVSHAAPECNRPPAPPTTTVPPRR